MPTGVRRVLFILGFLDDRDEVPQARSAAVQWIVRPTAFLTLLITLTAVTQRSARYGWAAAGVFTVGTVVAITVARRRRSRPSEDCGQAGRGPG